MATQQHVRHSMSTPFRPQTVTPVRERDDPFTVAVLDSQIDDCEREMKAQRAVLVKLRQYRLSLAPALALLASLRSRLGRLRRHKASLQADERS